MIGTGLARCAVVVVASLVLGPLAGCAREAPAVTVAIVDTGIDAGAPLGDRLDAGASRPTDLVDVDGHGTELAVVVHGAAPDARLVAVKVVGPQGTTDRQIARGVDRAREAGAAVILLSMAGAEPLPRTRAAIVRAGRDGTIVVAAAGNDGLDLDEHPAYPAAYAEPNLIAVAAVDRDGRLLGTSNRGSTVTAAGQGVAVPTCALDGEPATTGATSAAAALVAASAARQLARRTSADAVRRAVEAAPALAAAGACR